MLPDIGALTVFAFFGLVSLGFLERFPAHVTLVAPHVKPPHKSARIGFGSSSRIKLSVVRDRPSPLDFRDRICDNRT